MVTIKRLLLSSAFALWTLSHTAQALAVAPNALPSGGNVKGGNVDFDYSSANELHVHQNSERAYIEWDSFNIGTDALTQFHQTSSNAIAVNKVVGSGIDPTQILGTLNANGRVVVLDQNGIIFGKNATIDVGSIIASTGNIDAGAFMSGQDHFNITSIDTGGSIINEATITIAESGLAAFVAPTIVNEGIITARLGKVALAAGDQVTLDLYGDGLIEIAADDALTHALIEQNGSIHADGGFVQITAARAKHSVDNLINMDGIITANSITEQGGKIILSGGNISVAGSIEANGASGGGEILIGGDYQGTGDVLTAQNTLIKDTAHISANATDTGGGGKVIVWADDNTAFYGTIEAQGTVDGTGGFVEVSGKSYLDYNGDVNLNGGTGLGTLFLDPDDIDIVAGTANPAEFADDLIALAENSGGTSTIGADTIAGRLTANANVILQANNTIDVDAAITSAGTGDLTLETSAGGVISVNQAIDIDGAFTADADTGTINLGADITAEGITFNSTANVTGGTRVLDAGFGTMDIDAINAGAHQLSLQAADFNLSGNLTGTNRLSFVGPRAGWGLGIGDSEISSTQADLSDAELDLIQDGFDLINFSFTWGGSSIDVGARTWQDDVRFSTNSRDLRINGIQNVGANDLSIIASNNTHINADLIGTGTLSFTAENIGTDAGASGLSDAELTHIIDGWNSIQIQNTNVVIDTDGYQFSDPILFNMSVGATQGVLNINDNFVAAAGSNASFEVRSNADTVNINADIDLAAGDGTGNISFQQIDNLNIGADLLTAGGDITIADSVLATSLSAASTVDADSGTILIGTGGIDAGANNLSLYATDFNFSGALSGTSNITIGANNNVNFGLGDGQAGTAHLSDAELLLLQDGFTAINISSRFSGDINIGASNWTDSLRATTFSSGVINVNGNVSTNSNLRLDANDININGNLTSTANSQLTLSNNSDINIGDNTSDTNISDTELGHIQDGWGLLNFITFSTSGVNVNTNTYEFSDAVNFEGNGDISIDNISFAAGADTTLTVQGANLTAANININSDLDLSGSSNSGSITFKEANNLTIAGNLSTAGGNITIEDSILSTAATSGNRTFNASTGTISIGSGGWNSSFTNDTLIANDYHIGGAISAGNEFSGIGIQVNSGISVGLGDGQAGTAHFSDQELDYLNNAPRFSLTATDAAINIGAYSNWAGVTVNINAAGSSGSLSINGAQDFGSANIGFGTVTNNHSNIIINDTLSGTGELSFTSFRNGLGDNVVGAYLDDTELAQIQDGFSKVKFSHFAPTEINTTSPWLINAPTEISTNGVLTVSSDITAAIGSDASLNLRANNILSLNSAINLLNSSGNLTLSGDEIEVAGNLSGSGDIQLTAATSTQDIELGSTDAADLNLTTTELGFLQNGWNSITIGSSTHEGDISITDNVSFSDDIFLTTENVSDANFPGINVSGNITTTDNANLTISTDQGGNNFSWVGFETTGDLNIAGDLDISAVRRVNLLGTGNLIVGGDLTLNSNQSNQGQTVIENYATVNIGGNASLVSDNSDSFIRNVGSFTTGGNLTMTGGSPAYAPTDQAPFIQNITNFNIGGNMVVNSTDTGGDTRFDNVTTAIIQGDLTINGGDTGFTALSTDLTVNGNTTITSSAIDLQNTFTLTGNVDGSSTLTFLEGGQDGDMELGGTSYGSTWRLQAAEIDTIQNGFSSITFGSSSHTGDIYFSNDVTFTDDIIFRQDQTSSTAALWGQDGVTITTTDGADASFYIGDEAASWDLTSFNIAGDAVFSRAEVLGFSSSTIGGNLTASVDDDLYLHSVTNLSVGGDINFNIGDNFIVGFSAGPSLQADGDISIESRRVQIFAGSTISGNGDGSSNLTFVERGQDGDMEIGAALTGASWQMDDTEFAAIQNGFNSVTFGSSSMTGDITIDSLDMSTKQFDVSVEANDINVVDNDGAVSFGLKKGLSNFSAFARDNGADLGDITATSASIQSNNTGNIHLYADHDILFTSTGIFATGGMTNVLFNADRDADMDGGITLNNSDISTNGGYVVMGGGNGALGGINGILGDGDGTGADDAYAFRLNDAVYLRNDTDISTGAGNIFINGHGTGTGSFTRGVRFDFDGQSLQTTSGDISIKGLVTTGTDNQNGINITNTDITSVSGDISIYGEVLASSLDDNSGIRIVNTNPIQTDSGDITLTGIVNGSGNNSGIYFLNQTNILTNGAGTITLNATGTGSYDAISGNSGPGMIGGASASGNIIFNTNSIDLTKTVQTSGNVSFVPQTDGISIGVSTSAGTLDLSDSELANIDAGKIIFGSESLVSSPLFVNSWDLNGKNYNVEFLAKQVSFNGLVLGGGDITARAENIILNNPVNNNGQGGNMYLAATNQFTNNAGPGSIDPGSARFLIYIDNQEQLEANGLQASRRFSSTFSSNPPNTILGTNNLFIFAEDAPPVSNILQDTVQETINRISIRAKTNIEPPNRSMPKPPNKEQSDNLDVVPDNGANNTPANTNASVCLVAFKNASGCVL